MKTKSLFLMTALLLFGGIITSYGQQVTTSYVTSYGVSAGTSGHSVYVGSQAGANTIPYSFNNTSLYNTYVGHQAGAGTVPNSSGAYNTFLGGASGFKNETGKFNLFAGGSSGFSNTTGGWNVFLGFNSGYNNDRGNYNFFGGNESGKANVTGGFNVFLGNEAGKANTSGGNNVFVGSGAGQNNTDKVGNTYLGFAAGQYNNGQHNVYVGNSVGAKVAAGNSNVFIGNAAGPFTAPSGGTLSNALYINNIESDTPLILGQFGGTPTLKFNGNVEVNGNSANASGLKFADLTSATTAATANGKVLTVDANGNVILVNDAVGAADTTNTLASSVNTMTSTVNGVAANAPIVNSISNTITNGQLTTTVNGVASTPVTLPSGGVDTDAQTLSILGYDLTISNGNTITLPSLTEIDGSVSNELQTLTQSPIQTTGTAITLSNGGGTVYVDGSETKIQGGTCTTVTGNGTTASPYVINYSCGTNDDVNIYEDNGTLTGNRTVNMAGNNLIFKTGGNTKTTGGRIYIGDETPYFPTTTGDYRLNVEGGILTEKVKVALRSSANWADYVFADNYKLMPLNEVEAFVKENKHLPGVASAENLAKEGLDLGQMQAKQMEKIEELTLYVIDQNKTIEKQSKEIEELKAMVNALINKNK